MSTRKQKLELTWIGEGTEAGVEPHIRVEFASDPRDENSPLFSHEARLSICNLPRCGCSHIYFEWLPAPAESPAPIPLPREFWFSLNDKTIVPTPEVEKEPETLRVARIVAEELTDEDQQQLRRWFINFKNAIILSTPSTEIDISDLPYGGKGALIGFVEVFPSGLAVNFTFNGEDWALDDQYCVTPMCDCTDVALSFLKLRDSQGRVTKEIRNSPSLRYNYKTKNTQPLAPGPLGSPPTKDLMTALKTALPQLDQLLERRRLLMQSLYLRRAAHLLRSQLQAQGALPATSAKIGRNEPCPCGSGRKYKHCCLNKPKV